MATRNNDSSPPRSDMGTRTRSQSTLPGTPTRVTRSQLRRQSSNSSLPSPPKLTTTLRRRSVRAGSVESDVSSRDTKQPDKPVVKPPQRSTRRSIRSSITESVDDGPVSHQEGKLESIVEVVQLSPRRTRASGRPSLKVSNDSDTGIRLTSTRRTRNNSGSSIASASSCAASVTSPQRRTRSSRRNLSPVQSLCSDNSSVAVITEMSPQNKKMQSPVKEQSPFDMKKQSPGKGTDSNASSKSATPTSTPQSSNVSVSLKSPDKSSALRFSVAEYSRPALARLDASLTASPKVLQNESPRSERVSPNKQEGTCLNSEDGNRRSKGRLSLSSRRSSLKLPQFVTTPFKELKQKSEKPESPQAKSSEALKSRYSTRSSKSPVQLQPETLTEERRSSVSPAKLNSGLVPRIVLSSVVSAEQEEVATVSISSHEDTDDEVVASPMEQRKKSEVSIDVECESSVGDSSSVDIVASPVKQGKLSDSSESEDVVKGESYYHNASLESEPKDSDSDEVMECKSSPKISPQKDKEDSKDSDCYELPCADPLQYSSVPQTSRTSIDSSARRVSCGNLPFSTLSDSLMSNNRASTGSIKSKFEMKKDMKHSDAATALEKKRVSSESALNVESSADIGGTVVSKEFELSPTKLTNLVSNDLSPAKSSPISSICEYNQSPNKVHENLNEIEVSVDIESGPSQKVDTPYSGKKPFFPNSGSGKKSIFPGSDPAHQEAEKSVSSRVSINVLQDEDPISLKVYRDAAVLLSGGTISDFEEPDSDDNKWQLVFSPSSKSKKEERMEKKAKRKEEKELRKKSKLEKAQKFSQTHKKKNECESSTPAKYALNELNQFSPQNSEGKETNQSCEEDDNIDDSNDSLPAGADYCSQILKHFNIDPSEIGSKKAEPSYDNHSELKPPGKKRKRAVEELASSDLHLAHNLKTKIGNAKTTATHFEGCSIKTQKKKMKKIQAPIDEGIDFSNEEVSAKETKKMRKKKLIDGEGVSQGAVEEVDAKDKLEEGLGALNDINVRKKKKKSKSQSVTVEDCLEDVVVSTKSGKNSKKRKSEALLFEAENTDGTHKKKKVKKSEKKLTLSSDPTQSGNEVNEINATEILDKKKSKKKKKKAKEDKIKSGALVPGSNMETGGSDSDDTPVAVSFAEGKLEALAELHAAAQNIEKQKELRRQKLRQKQEKILEQKLAKIERIKKKQKHSQASVGWEPLSEAGCSSKLLSGKDKILSKSSIKPPKRLPDDVLESLSDQPSASRPSASKRSDTLTQEEQDRLERKRAKKLAKKLKQRELQESSYIPLEGVLGSTRFGVVPLRNVMLAKKLQQNKLAEEAANFRQQSLFGNRIGRTPISKILAHQEKLKASGKDRLVTSKKY